MSGYPSINTNPTATQLTPLTVFVACPGDCVPEREIVNDVASELEVLANSHGYTLRVRDWRQAVPGMGRPQQVIFDQLPVTTWDIFVGTLWLRFGMRSGGTNVVTGTPAESGTEEEFACALEAYRSTGRPRILFYRRTSGPADMSHFDVSQFNFVQEFFKKFDVSQAYQGLYKPYEGPEDFRKKLREHMLALLVSGNIGGEVLAQISEIGLSAELISSWRNRLLRTYDILKLHRISSAYDAGSVLRSDRDRVRLHDVFVPQHVCDVSAFVAERLPAPHDLGSASLDELRLLGMQQHHDLRKAKRHNVFDIMESRKNRKIVLLGDPGAGKSSLLQYRALTWARDSSGQGPLPLLLEMRQYLARVVRARDERERQPTLLSWAGELLGSGNARSTLSEDAIAHLLSEGALVIYCDALDEIFDSALRHSTAEQLAQIATQIPKAQVIVTSRPVGYPDDVLSSIGFSHWMVQDFDKTQICQFLNRWIVAALPDDDDKANVAARMNTALVIPRVREMSGTPLLLTLMCILARTDELPRNRMRLYAKAAELLLYQWDTSRSLKPISGLDFAYEQKHRVLRELAWRMQNAQLGLGGNLAPLEMVREVFDDELRADLDRPSDRARGVSLLLETLRERDHVLCHLGGDRFAFVHRGFLEYFCADWLFERVRRAPSTAEQNLFEIFDRYARVPAWFEVLSLGVLGLAPEVVDPMLANIQHVLMKRGSIPRWLSDATLIDDKAKARFPKTAAMLHGQLKLAIEKGYYSLANLINQLVRFWPDEDSRSLLTNIINDSKTSTRVRRLAVLLLASTWRDEQTRSSIETVAMQNHAKVSRVAIVELAKYWPDERTRKTLTRVASRPERPRVSTEALRQLAKYWPDEKTLGLLQRIATQKDSTRLRQFARALQRDLAKRSSAVSKAT